MAMKNETYDLAIIGAGPGGYVSAIRAGQLEMKVALIEKDEVGGACLHLGCIPSKALLRNAEVVTLFGRAKEFGISCQEFKADYSQAVKRSRRVVSTLTKGIEFLLKKNNVELVKGTGSLAEKGLVEVTSVDTGGKTRGLRARNILLATGSRPRSLPGLAVDGKRVVTSDEAVLIEKLPNSVLIIGGGPLGVEFGYVYAAYGVKVILLEALPRILTTEDKELADLLARSLTKMGLEILVGHKVEKVNVNKEGVAVLAAGPKGQKEIKAAQILVAIGRGGVSDIPGLKELGIATEKGFVTVDENYQTSVPGIYAIGDLIGAPMLAHVASAEGIATVEALAGKERRRINYDNIPRCIYCQPQLAGLGLTEEEAQAKGFQVKVGRFPFRANGKALAIGEPEGLVKVLAEAKYGEILGVHILGTDATEMITEFATARTLEGTPREIMETVHPHPTLSEAIMEASAAIYGQAIHFVPTPGG